MEEIKSEFEILKKGNLSKSSFEEKEIFLALETNVYCLNCSSTIKLKVAPFDSGWTLTDLYIKNQFIDLSELLKWELGELSKPNQTHLDPLTIRNLHPLYFTKYCNKCKERHLFVFVFGETQPSRMQIIFSGFWMLA